MSNGSFDFNLFVKDSKDVLVDPNYFATMKTTGGFVEPLIKAVIYGAVAGVITLIYGLLHIGVSSFGMFGSAIGIAGFFFSIIGAIIGLFILAVIILVLSAICSGSTDFEINLRVAAALLVIMPIKAALGFFTGINYYLGAVVDLLVNIFALWLTYKALVQALKAKPETARIVMYVLAALFVLFTLVGMNSWRKAGQFMNNFNSSEIKEMIEQND